MQTVMSKAFLGASIKAVPTAGKVRIGSARGALMHQVIDLFVC